MRVICTVCGIAVGIFLTNAAWLANGDTARLPLFVFAVVFGVAGALAIAYDWD